MSKVKAEANKTQTRVKDLKKTISELEAELKRSSKSELLYLSVLHQTTVTLKDESSVSDLMETILSHASTLIGVKDGFIRLSIEDVQVSVGIGCFADEFADLLDDSNFMPDEKWSSGTPDILKECNDWTNRHNPVTSDQCETLCAIPVSNLSSIKGGMVLSAPGEPDSPLQNTDLEHLSRFVEVAALAFENYHLNLQAQDGEFDQVRAKSELKKSEDKFRILFEDSFDTIYIADKNDILEDVNPYVIELLGFTRDEIIGSPVSKIYLDRNDRRKVRDQIEKNGFVRDYPVRLRHKNNDQIECLENSHVQRSENGKVYSYQGTFRDITERLRSEKAIRDSEQKFRTLAEQAQLGIMTIQDNKCVYMNEACSRVLDMSSEQLLNRDKDNFTQKIHQDDREQLFEKLEMPEDLETEIPVVCEVRFFSNNHGMKWLSINSKWIVFEEKPAVELVVVDVTEHRMIEEQLRFRYALEKVLTTTSNRFMNLEPNEVDGGINIALQELGVITDADRSWLILFEESIGEIETVYEWSGSKVAKNMSSLIRQDITLISDMMEKYERDDAVYRPNVDDPSDLMLDGLNPIIQDETKAVIIVPISLKGEVQGYLGIEAISGQRRWSEDIVTLLKMVGEIFINALESRRVSRALDVSEVQFRQAQKMEAVGQLAGGIAHDFNNILTVIAGQAELMDLTLQDNHPIRESVAKIHEVTDRAATLIKQLLAFSSMQTLKPTVIDIGEMVDQMKQTMIRLLGAHIGFTSNIPEGLWRVKVDQGQFQQVIVNLIVNSRDAMPEGGTIQIEARNIEFDEQANRQPDAIKAGEYIKLTIRDDGVGMSREVISRIYDPFFTTKTQGKGTGLGLSMVYGFIKQSEGYIRVESAVDSGTIFNIYLPRVAESTGPTVELPTQDDLVGGKEKILIVEDEDSVRQVAVSAMKLIGYDVREAACGSDALDICNEMDRPFDLILSDVIMPSMSGPRLAIELRKLWPDIRILFMSGYAAEELNVEGFSHTTGTYLQKPFRLAVLAQKVRETLDALPQGLS